MTTTDIKEALRKKIVKLARKCPPIKSHWAFAISGLIFGGAWSLLPGAFIRMNDLPILQDIVKSIPHWPIISSWAGYLLAFLFSLFAIPPLCKGIQICYPEEFEAFENERELIG